MRRSTIDAGGDAPERGSPQRNVRKTSQEVPPRYPCSRGGVFCCEDAAQVGGGGP
jgi:hypothetical protein